MLWYLTQAFTLQTNESIKKKISSLIDKTEELTLLDADSLLVLDVEAHRTKVNMMLKNTSEIIRTKAKAQNRNKSSFKNSIFLTQSQINTAKGDSHTKLPKMLVATAASVNCFLNFS
ncbi:hypothetical protein NRP93_001319 [Clostridium botulinum]|nr:hypothetical protein [Clostridium botulinum]